MSVMLATAPCSKCGGNRESNYAYCLSCRAAYMRDWRSSHPMTDEQRRRDSTRSYANVYKRRGQLVPKPCSCGLIEVEMHHPDYDRPLDVVWKCRPCHLKHHKESRT